METPARRWVDVAVNRVRLTCPTCAVRADIPVHHVRLYRCLTRENADFYAWLCPECEEPVARQSDVSSGCILIGTGVPMIQFSWPKEMGDPERKLAAWSHYDEADYLLDVRALPEVEGAA